MDNLTHTQNNEVGVITLKDILDLINEDRNLRGSKDIQHSKAMTIVKKMASESPSFGLVSKIDTINLNKLKVQTYLLTRNQAIAVGGKLDTERLMMVIKKVDELEKAKAPQVQLPSKIELAQMVIEAETRVLKLEKTVEAKDEIILAVADLNIQAGEVTIGDFSKNLAIEGFGRNNLFTWLRGRGFLALDTSPYQQYVNRGYFVRKPSKHKHGGEVRYTTLLTPKGTIWLTKMLKAEYDLD